MALPKFSGAGSFHADLKKRIQDYFASTGNAPTGNYKLFLKGSVLMVLFVALYSHLVFYTPVAWLAILECMMLGGVIAAIGFNVMHDGAHGSFSKYKWINHLAAFSLNVLGGNSFMWNMKHNIIHHAYTNIDGVDDDIDIQPWLRMSTDQKKYRMHKYQHMYFWFLYSMLYILWVFVHYFLFIGLPIYLTGWLSWMVGFLICTLVAGFTISIVFQLAHTVEHTEFPTVGDNSKMKDEWAIHQIKTTANFATKNRLVSWLIGGLNFQIEHHLFPKISHIHYPAISNIIRQVCQEYGLQYIEYRRMRHAVVSHVSFLKKMGQD